MVRSPYLLGILAIVLLYEISSVLADYQFSSYVAAEFPGPALADQRTAYLGRFAMVAGLIGLAIQLLATSLVLRRLGLGAALSVLPVALIAALACLPIFITGARIARGEGALFLGAYLAYLGYMIYPYL